MARDQNAILKLAQRAAQLADGSVVHVVEDDEPVRHAFDLLLAAAGIRTVLHPTADAFLDSVGPASDPIACVLTDLRMPGIDGLELLRRLRERGFARPVLMVTARGDIPTAVQAMKDGAADFIEKPCTDMQLLSAIVRALETDGVATVDTAQAAARARIATLTQREHQVLTYLAQGRPNKEIARLLELSPRTVEIHRARMMTRLGVRSFAEAVRLAVQAGEPLGPPGEMDGQEPAQGGIAGRE